MTARADHRGRLVLALLALGVAVIVLLGWQRQRSAPPTDTGAEASDPVRDALLRGREPATPSPLAERYPDPSEAQALPDGYAMSGRVYVGTTKAGVAGARIQVALTFGARTESLGRTTSAADGTWALALPRLAAFTPLELRRGTITVWAISPGYAVENMKWSRSLRSLRGPVQWEVDLELYAALGVEGRVVDADGNPVAFAKVWGFRDSAPSSFCVTTDEEGRYRVPIPASVLPRDGTGDIRVRVHVAGLGVGRVGPLKSADAEDRTLHAPELVLEGRGVLAGVALFPDGTPATDVKIEASRDRATRASGEEGLERGSAWTDEDGRFHIAGLQPGTYHVEADAPHAPRVRTSTPDASLRLTVAAHRVRVLVRDAEGRPLPGADVTCRRRRPDGYSSTSAGPLANRRASRSWWEPPGTHLKLEAILHGGAVAGREVTLHEGVWSQDVVLTLDESPETWGWFRLHVLGPDGERIHRYRLEVGTPLTGFRVGGLPLGDDPEDGRHGPLPPGSWRLYLQPVGDTVEERGFWMAGHTEMHVPPRGTTDVRFRPQIGGRIRATVDANARTEEDDDPGLVLTHRNGRTETTLWLGWDEPEVSEVLEPGTWSVHSETEGFSATEREVVVVAGRIVDVALTVVRN